jgi:hypothetical protein
LAEAADRNAGVHLAADRAVVRDERVRSESDGELPTVLDWSTTG